MLRQRWRQNADEALVARGINGADFALKSAIVFGTSGGVQMSLSTEIIISRKKLERWVTQHTGQPIKLPGRQMQIHAFTTYWSDGGFSKDVSVKINAQDDSAFLKISLEGNGESFNKAVAATRRLTSLLSRLTKM
jgi:hypothetical protein